MSRKRVCWNITTKCNESCKYCHRFLGIDELSYDDNEKILYNLIKDGITDITWTRRRSTIISKPRKVTKDIKRKWNKK